MFETLKIRSLWLNEEKCLKEKSVALTKHKVDINNILVFVWIPLLIQLIQSTLKIHQYMGFQNHPPGQQYRQWQTIHKDSAGSIVTLLSCFLSTRVMPSSSSSYDKRNDLCSVAPWLKWVLNVSTAAWDTLCAAGKCHLQVIIAMSVMRHDLHECSGGWNRVAWSLSL